MIKKKPTILAVDDDQELLELYRTGFEKNYNLFTADNGKKALEICERKNIQLIILDLMMPDISGAEVLECVKKKAKMIGIIVVTALKNDAEIAVKCWKLGVYDYIFKPFEPNDLLAIVQSFFYHIDYRKENKKILEAGGIRMDLNIYETTVLGEKKGFTPKEFDLLYVFLKKPDKVLSREEICKKLYGRAEAANLNALKMHFKRLKQKFPPSVVERFQTIPGKGIIFLA